MARVIARFKKTDDGVSLSFRTENILKLNDVNADKQLCTTCTQKVKVFIRNSAETQ